MVIAYDSDAAGEKAAVQLAVRLVAAGMDAWRVRFPQGQDAIAFALEDLASAQGRLGDVIRKALPLSKGRPPDGRPAPVPAPPILTDARATEEEEAVPEPIPSLVAESAPPAARVEPPAPPDDVLADVPTTRW